MSVIPQDILDAADRATLECYEPKTQIWYDVRDVIARAILADRQRDQWQDISTAPKDGQFLAYGSYLYPDDKAVTEYINIVEPTGVTDWPFETEEGQAANGAFTHWQPLPSAPKGTPT